ncbi:MAG: MFS transporter [Armatimonadetes bacterium]|nr:MFS transporter [Armatimonadota bacterium]
MAASEASNGEQSRLRASLRALNHRNYRLFFVGQGISVIGTWMQMVATGWLVNRLTHGDAAMLGLVGFANRAPSAFLTPFAGVLIDRVDKHRLILHMQAAAMLQALALAALALNGVIEVWHVMVLSAGLGLVAAIEVPARQSFVVEMVANRDDLGNAIALNSSLFNGARLVGPAVAGTLIALWGEGICFLLNGLSYLAVIIALLRMQVAPFVPPEERVSVWVGLREGVAYAYGFGPIRALLLLVAVVSLMGMPYQVLMPIYAEKVLGQGAQGLGLLMAAGGFGAFCGALYLAQRKSVRGLGRVIPLAACVFAGGLTLLSLSRELWLSLLLMPLVAGGMMIQMASTNTVLQTIVDDDKRGRVMSLYALAFMGTSPLGSLLAGGLASRIGVPATFQVCAVATVVPALVFLSRLPRLRELARPIYQRKGIIPEVAAGMQSAAEATTGLRD